ncbi:MAG: FAD-dependent oxidoreductase [Hyphomicrobiales bacterium]|nr:FAD-dependent oxidoreductase [Hyphomicrobiales bacterium]MDE2115360.1 FAD-dependent oxidoreductase [Hyphomicrobiales bacterium]
MAVTLTPDICVIGAGSGGLSVAAAAASMGVRVVLVEKARMGGDCLNYGCVPSKSLIAAAHVAHTMRHAKAFGVAGVEPQVDMAATRAHIRAVIAHIAPNDSVERFGALGVKVIPATARFTSPTSCEAGEYVIHARRFVIATGSAPAMPKLPGIELIRPLTNESVFDLDALPSRLVILGGGPVGMEMAQAFRRLGSEVVVVASHQILPRDDPELALPLRLELQREGVILRENATAVRVEPRGTGIRLFLQRQTTEETIDGSHLLIAIGRKPNVTDLGLDAAKVQYSAAGIKTGTNLRTSNKKIYAIGDVAGQGQFTHLANAHAGIVLRAILFRLPARIHPDLVPHVTYCDPELASVGLSENQARAKGGVIHVLRWPFSENDRAQSERATAGLIKVITAANGRILGAAITGRGAGELISLWTLAIQNRMKIGAIAGMIIPYPTRSEVSRRAAIGYYSKSLRNPLLGPILRLLARFG